jgi:hypothetical protein
MSNVTGVVWLLLGVDAHHSDRETRKALTLLRRAGFVANTATPQSIFAKAEELRAKQTENRKTVIER